MARKTPGFPDKTTFNTLKGLLRRREPLGESLGKLLAARGLVDLAVASLSHKGIRALVDEPENRILVEPATDGKIHFSVDVNVGDSVSILIGPDDFDHSIPKDLQQLKVYRLLVDVMRRAPDSDEGDRCVRVGPFEVFCDSVEYGPLWVNAWQRWEHSIDER